MLLRFIARHSTLIMPVCAIVGFVFPDLSNAVLVYLPQVLFFLMFFTLLGIDQYALLKRIATRYVWVFALFQSAGMSLVLTLIAYMLGLRGDWLLAIAGLGATAPLFGSGALVNAVGFDAQLATAKTIAATLVMPCTLLGVLWFLGDKNAHLDTGLYIKRLFVYIVLPMVLAVGVRRFVSPAILLRYYPKIGQFNILLLMLFPLGLMAGFRSTFDHDPWQALLLLVLSSVLALVFYFTAYFIYRRFGDENAIVAALVCGGRNVLLAYTITVPFMGAVFLPLLGAFQLPAFCLPLLGKYMAKRYLS
ncbi:MULTISPECIES: lantibiotic ABC transporter permease [Psychrobacter]|uniref:lantibiotic ABC transporter permease n=1 Tax=Psychrobacter TaxID=497 RepID=UPI00146D02E3|nr:MULTISPECIES: lantibiotic ABC transporter permease [Psychrobacter]